MWCCCWLLQDGISNFRRKSVECSLQVGDEILPQVEELKYLVLEGRREREMDRRIVAASAVMQILYRSVMVKEELSQKVTLSIYWSTYVAILNYGRASYWSWPKEHEPEGGFLWTEIKCFKNFFKMVRFNDQKKFLCALSLLTFNPLRLNKQKKKSNMLGPKWINKTQKSHVHIIHVALSIWTVWAVPRCSEEVGKWSSSLSSILLEVNESLILWAA